MSKNSGKLLPIHPSPLKDELFSSWVYRLAISNHLKIRSFTQLVLGKKTFWTRDVDRISPESAIKTLAIKTGNTYHNIKETCLNSYEGVIFEDLNNKSGFTPGILTLGMYHRTHRRYGQQYCPQCLGEGIPYYRKKWRLAYVTGCPSHNCQLLDSCPKCLIPVSFQRCDYVNRVYPSEVTINHCFNCQYNLADAPIIKLSPLQASVTDLIDKTIDQGYIQLSSTKYIYSHLYFQVLRKLIYLLSSRKQGHKLRTHLTKKYGFAFGELKRAGLEKYRVSLRSQLIVPIVWMLRDWPFRFIEIIKGSNIELFRILSMTKSETAHFFSTVLDLEFCDKKYEPTYEEFLSAERYLISLGLEAGNKNISAILGAPYQHKLFNQYRKRVNPYH